MNADEKAIIDYLKGWPNTFVSGKEIARKVGGKERYDDDRGWALSILAQMVRTGLVEADYYGYFRLKLDDPKKKRTNRHVSPQILRILKTSGRSFEGIVIDEEDSGGPTPYRPPSKSPAGEGEKR
jgi:hypothetical protein